jgi:hypothetical protein
MGRHTGVLERVAAVDDEVPGPGVAVPGVRWVEAGVPGVLSPCVRFVALPKPRNLPINPPPGVPGVARPFPLAPLPVLLPAPVLVPVLVPAATPGLLTPEESSGIVGAGPPAPPLLDAWVR